MLYIFAAIGIAVVFGILFYLVDTKCPRIKNGIMNLGDKTKEKISSLKEDRKRKRMAAHMEADDFEDK